MGFKGQKSIYDAMFDQKVVSSRTFSLCLGQDGSYFQIGGLNKDKFIGQTDQFNLKYGSRSSFIFGLNGVSMGDHMI